MTIHPQIKLYFIPNIIQTLRKTYNYNYHKAKQSFNQLKLSMDSLFFFFIQLVDSNLDFSQETSKRFSPLTNISRLQEQPNQLLLKENDLLKMDLLNLNDEYQLTKEREQRTCLENLDLQQKLKDMEYRLIEWQKEKQRDQDNLSLDLEKLQTSQQMIEMDNENRKKLEQNLQEKDNLIKKLKKELDQTQKKVNYQNQDYNYQIAKLKTEIEDNLKGEIEELKSDNEEYKNKQDKLTEEFNKICEQLKVAKEECYQLLGHKNQNEQTISELQQCMKKLNEQVFETEQQNHQQNGLMQQSHNQELNRLKNQLDLQYENYQKELQNTQMIMEKDKELIRQLCIQRESDQNEIKLLINELEVQQAQIEELKKQSQLQTHINDEQLMDQEKQLCHKYEYQIGKLLKELDELQKDYENKYDEQECLQMKLNQYDLKLQDLTQLNSYISQENDQLKKTLFALQNQREMDENSKEELKKRDMINIQQYYETIQEQLHNQIDGLQNLLDSKTQECDQWRSTYFRQLQ